MGKPYHKYHDDWIVDHYDPTVGWRAILDEYNKVFDCDVSYGAFVTHIFKKLKIQQEPFKYSDEMNAFLKETYPVYGGKKTTKMFNEHFHTDKTLMTIFNRCNKLGLKPDEKRIFQEKSEWNYKRKTVGAITSGTYGTPAVKTENGWERLDRKLIGKIRPDELIVHLDGNKTNNAPDNLMVIQKSITTRMAKNHFWSDNPVITKTGILWCQLDEALSRNGFNKHHRLRTNEAYNKKPPKVVCDIYKPSKQISNTGERYIMQQKRDGLYRLSIKNSELYYIHTFRTLDEAMRVRNLLIDGVNKRKLSARK